MTFPISRQGLEQIALALAVGVVLFGVLALLRWRRKDDYRRFAISAGIIAALAVVALIIGYTVAPNIPTPPVPLTARQANCAICHGIAGRGDGPAAFTLVPRPVNLQLHVPQHAPGELLYWISTGIPGTAMPAWGDIDPSTGKPKLSEEERWSIIRYLQALSRGETP